MMTHHENCRTINPQSFQYHQDDSGWYWGDCGQTRPTLLPSLLPWRPQRIGRTYLAILRPQTTKTALIRLRWVGGLFPFRIRGEFQSFARRRLVQSWGAGHFDKFATVGTSLCLFWTFLQCSRGFLWRGIEDFAASWSGTKFLIG